MRIYFFCMNGVKGADRYRAFGEIFDGDRVLLAFFQFVLLIEGIADDRDADEKENEERIICSAEEWYEEADTPLLLSSWPLHLPHDLKG